jgi:DNA-binding NarL/FixJ family response regulator
VETDEATVALHSYQVTPADVVLLNVLASGRLDAAEFLRRLRREFPDARVVAVAGRTSQTGADPLALAHSMGAVQTLRIPAAPEAVLQAVELARA